MPVTGGWISYLLRQFIFSSLDLFSQEVARRMMRRWTVPVEKGDETIKDGSLAKTIESLLRGTEARSGFLLP